jgi:hypothetical protein
MIYSETEKDLIDTFKQLSPESQQHWLSHGRFAVRRRYGVNLKDAPVESLPEPVSPAAALAVSERGG